MRRPLYLALASFALAAPALHAAPITYTETAVASGTLGSGAFTNALITLTGTGDTSAVTFVEPGIPAVPVLMQVSVAGIGAATVTDSTSVFSNQGAQVAGFADDTARADILDIVNAAFASYGAVTSIGPLTGENPFTGFPTVGTSLGSFHISSVSGNVTFQAVLGPAVPEPSSLVMAGAAALAGLGFAARRRMRAR